MRNEGRRRTWATNTLPSRAFSPSLSHRVPHIFLTALRAYGAVASRLGPYETLLPYGKRATSSRIADQLELLPLPNRGDAFPEIALAQRGEIDRRRHGLHGGEDLLG